MKRLFSTRRRIIGFIATIVVLIVVVIPTGIVFAVQNPFDGDTTEVLYDDYDSELAEVQELQIILSDLMMAIDVRERLLSGNENLISFSDGTEIKMDVSSSLIKQLDDQIVKLKGMFVDKAREKESKWKK